MIELDSYSCCVYTYLTNLLASLLGFMMHSLATHPTITDIIDDIAPTLIPVRSSAEATMWSETFLRRHITMHYAAEPHGEGFKIDCARR